jgi:hypothetical protein
VKGVRNMSLWTYVIGSICVDTHSDNAVEKVKNFLDIAPKITGSERDVDIFLNQPIGYNCYESDFDKNGIFIEHEYESRVVITLFGTLRDRQKQQTQEEVLNFMQYLMKNFDIEYQSITVTI